MKGKTTCVMRMRDALRTLYKILKERIEDFVLLVDFIEKIERFRKPMMIILKVIFIAWMHHH
ncbi:MAG: hypothetical protein ACKVTZ_04210 [Bacteroidia bacterium]